MEYTDDDPAETEKQLTKEKSNEYVWEMNHEMIIRAIRSLQGRGIKPSITSIAFETDLTRTTIYRHLKDDALSPVYKTYTRMHKFLLNDVLMRISEKALCGDVRAARLYFELMGIIKTKATTINTIVLNGNNAVNVNGHKLTDEMIQSLSPENLSQLEEFIKAAEQQ